MHVGRRESTSNYYGRDGKLVPRVRACHLNARRGIMTFSSHQWPPRRRDACTPFLLALRREALNSAVPPCCTASAPAAALLVGSVFRQRAQGQAPLRRRKRGRIFAPWPRERAWWPPLSRLALPTTLSCRQPSLGRFLMRGPRTALIHRACHFAHLCIPAMYE